MSGELIIKGGIIGKASCLNCLSYNVNVEPTRYIEGTNGSINGSVTGYEISAFYVAVGIVNIVGVYRLIDKYAFQRLSGRSACGEGGVISVNVYVICKSFAADGDAGVYRLNAGDVCVTV